MRILKQKNYVAIDEILHLTAVVRVEYFSLKKNNIPGIAEVSFNINIIPAGLPMYGGLSRRPGHVTTHLTAGMHPTYLRSYTDARDDTRRGSYFVS